MADLKKNNVLVTTAKKNSQNFIFTTYQYVEHWDGWWIFWHNNWNPAWTTYQTSLTVKVHNLYNPSGGIARSINSLLRPGAVMYCNQYGGYPGDGSSVDMARYINNQEVGPVLRTWVNPGFYSDVRIPAAGYSTADEMQPQRIVYFRKR